jgi:hypothetical protein
MIESRVGFAIVIVAALGLLSGCSGGDAEGSGGAGGTRSPDAAVDRSDLSFVGNLQAKVADGEWTLGEGLVATLELFAGERDAASVLRHPELINAEGTGILALAYEYLEDGSDAEAKAEITRLLPLLVFSTEQLEAMAGLAPSVPKAAADDCGVFFTGFQIPPGIDKCLQVRSSPVLDDFYAEDYRVFGPAASLPTAGWTEHHYNLTIEALEASVPVLKALGDVKLSDVSIVLSVKDNPPAAAAAAPKMEGFADRPCGVVLYVAMQQEEDGNFKQFIAHELAHCLHGETFPKQNYDNRAWWDEGLSEYWSNVVYPNNNAEWEWLDPLARVELTTTLFDRDYENSLFFQYLSRHVGNEGIVEVIKSLGDTNERTAHEGKLAAYPGMGEILHDFAKAKTDEQIIDTSGQQIPFRITEVNRPTITLTGPQLIGRDFEPFGVSRFRLVVEEDKLASLAFQGDGPVRESARPSNDMSWREVPSRLPDDECNPDIIIVVTSTERSSFELDVPDVKEVEASCGIEGTWVVDNNSLLFKSLIYELKHFRGEIRATFGRDGNVEVVYDDFESAVFQDDILEVGGEIIRRHEEFIRTTNAQGVTTYDVIDDVINFGHFFESDYLVGVEEVRHIRMFNPQNVIGPDIDSTTERDAVGQNLFNASEIFALESGGTVLRFLGVDEDFAVLHRVGPAPKSAKEAP